MIAFGAAMNPGQTAHTQEQSHGLVVTIYRDFDVVFTLVRRL